MNRSWICGLLAGVAGLIGASQALGEPTCRPVLAFKQVAFSPMQPPTMQRKWTAVVAVDASRCAAHARGSFEVVLTRLQEFGPDSEFRASFTWASPTVTVSVDFAPTEAVQDYAIGRIASCPCAAK
jgi:hypothetical protein